MSVFTKEIVVIAPGKSTSEFTSMIEEALAESRQNEGTVTVFCRHTSCSLVIMENADPSARRDLEAFIDRLVPKMTRISPTLTRVRMICRVTLRWH